METVTANNTGSGQKIESPDAVSASGTVVVESNATVVSAVASTTSSPASAGATEGAKKRRKRGSKPEASEESANRAITVTAANSSAPIQDGASASSTRTEDRGAPTGVAPKKKPAKGPQQSNGGRKAPEPSAATPAGGAEVVAPTGVTPAANQKKERRQGKKNDRKVVPEGPAEARAAGDESARTPGAPGSSAVGGESSEMGAARGLADQQQKSAKRKPKNFAAAVTGNASSASASGGSSTGELALKPTHMENVRVATELVTNCCPHLEGKYLAETMVKSWLSKDADPIYNGLVVAITTTPEAVATVYAMVFGYDVSKGGSAAEYLKAVLLPCYPHSAERFVAEMFGFVVDGIQYRRTRQLNATPYVRSTRVAANIMTSLGFALVKTACRSGGVRNGMLPFLQQLIRDSHINLNRKYSVAAVSRAIATGGGAAEDASMAQFTVCLPTTRGANIGVHVAIEISKMGEQQAAPSKGHAAPSRRDRACQSIFDRVVDRMVVVLLQKGQSSSETFNKLFKANDPDQTVKVFNGAKAALVEMIEEAMGTSSQRGMKTSTAAIRFVDHLCVSPLSKEDEKCYFVNVELSDSVMRIDEHMTYSVESTASLESEVLACNWLVHEEEEKRILAEKRVRELEERTRQLEQMVRERDEQVHQSDEIAQQFEDKVTDRVHELLDVYSYEETYNARSREMDFLEHVAEAERREQEARQHADEEARRHEAEMQRIMMEHQQTVQLVANEAAYQATVGLMAQMAQFGSVPQSAPAAQPQEIAKPRRARRGER